MTPDAYARLLATLLPDHPHMLARGGHTYPVLVFPAAGPTATLDGAVQLDATAAPPTLAFYADDHLAAMRASGRRFYDGATLAALTLDPAEPRLTVRPSTYFAAAATCDALEAELHSACATLPTPPTSRDLPRRTVLLAHVPVAQFAFSGAGRSAKVGASVLVVARTGDGYTVLMARRSAATAAAPGLFHVLPAYMLVPGRTPSAQLWRELNEELFGLADDAPDDTPDAPAVQQVRAWLADGRAGLTLTGVAFNVTSGHYDVCGLLLIHQDGWLASALAAPGWETGALLRLPLHAPDAHLAAAMPAHQFAPHGAAAFWLGVDAARHALTTSGAGGEPRQNVTH